MYFIRMASFDIGSWFLLLVIFIGFSAAEVVKLTDGTFEHQTQASTGSTTGSWLILFHLPDCKSCDKLKPILDELGNDEELYENGIVLGSVDCSTNLHVCRRFSTTKLPVLMYLHKKRLYRYPLKREHNEFDNLMVLPDVKKLKSFAIKDYSRLSGGDGEIIPDPLSDMDVLMKQIMEVFEGSPLVKFAVFGMAGIMMLTILTLIVTLVRGNSTNIKTTKSKKKVK